MRAFLLPPHVGQVSNLRQVFNPPHMHSRPKRKASTPVANAGPRPTYS